jgi:hypothetical protein
LGKRQKKRLGKDTNQTSVKDKSGRQTLVLDILLRTGIGFSLEAYSIFLRKIGIA